MRKQYLVLLAVSGLAGALSYNVYQQVINVQHSENLSSCITRLDKLRKQTATIERVNLYPFQNHLYRPFGFKTKKGQVAIQPIFATAEPFSEGRSMVADRNWYRGFIDSHGKIVIPYRFGWASSFIGGVAAFSGTREDRELNGFIDRDGKIIIQYRGATIDEYFRGFKNGRATVYVHDSLSLGGNPIRRIYGYVDCTGRVTFEK